MSLTLLVVSSRLEQHGGGSHQATPVERDLGTAASYSVEGGAPCAPRTGRLGEGAHRAPGSPESGHGGPCGAGLGGGLGGGGLGARVEVDQREERRRRRRAEGGAGLRADLVKREGPRAIASEVGDGRPGISDLPVVSGFDGLSPDESAARTQQAEQEGASGPGRAARREHDPLREPGAERADRASTPQLPLQVGRGALREEDCRRRLELSEHS